MIPLIWPAYALVNGELDYWWDGIYWQTHRQEENMNFIDINKQDTLSNAIVKDFFNMPILMALGLVGLVYVTVKKDFFLLLWTIPFLTFLYFLGFVRDFHLIPLLPALSISAARLIADLSDKVNFRKVRNILPFSIASAIAIFGLITLVPSLIFNNNDDRFSMAALVLRYLEENKNQNITTISNDVYSCIPKYVFLLGNDYMIPELEIEEKPQNEKVLMVVDDAFKYILSGDDQVGKHLLKIYNDHSKIGTSTVEVRSNKIIMPEPSMSHLTQNGGINLVDSWHVWKSKTSDKISQNDHKLNIIFKTNDTGKIIKYALLQTQLRNVTETPLLLSLNYTSKSPNPNTKFFVEIIDSDEQNIRYLRGDLRNTSGNLTSQLFILPGNIGKEPVEFRLVMVTNSPGEHVLNVKRAAIIFSI